MPFPGSKLRDRRESLGLSAQQVGEMIGKTRAYINHLEVGERANPSYEVLELLCDLLKVPGGYFSDVSPTPLDEQAVPQISDVPAKRGRGRPKKAEGEQKPGK